MRSKTGIILLAALALSVAAVATAADSTVAAPPPPPQEQPPFASRLPDTAALVISIPDIGEIKTLVTDPAFIRLLSAAGLSENLFEGLGEIDERLHEMVGLHLRDLFEALNGELTIAVLDIESASDFDVALLAGIAGAEETIQGLLDRILEMAPQGVEMTRHSIAGVGVFGLDQKAFLAIHSGRLILTNSTEAMEQMLAPPSPLARSQSFLRHRELTGMSSGLVVYIDFPRIMALIGNSMPPTANTQIIDTISSLFGLSAIESISATIPLTEGERLRIFVRVTEPAGILPHIFSSRPVGTGIAAVVPASAQAFAATSINDAELILDAVVREIAALVPTFQAATFEAFEQQFATQLGISLREDFLAPLGNQAAITISYNPEFEFAGDMAASPAMMFQFMRMQFIFSLDDSEHFLASLRTVTDIPGIPIREEVYGKAHIFAVTVPNIPVAPALTVYGDYFIFSLNMDGLHAAIDELDSGRSLLNDPDFLAAALQIPRSAFFISYMSDEYYRNALSLGLQTLTALGGAGGIDVEALRTAILDFVRHEGSDVGFATARDDGIYIEADFSVRGIVAMIPIFAAMKSSDDAESETEAEEEAVPEAVH